MDTNGVALFTTLDRNQITVAAFLNLFVAWETFLESTITNLMAGSPTLLGTLPAKCVSPANAEAALTLLTGTMRFFDFANHDNVKKMVNVYFDGGYPFEPHLSAIFSDLADLRTMRNASAHLTSTTQTSLEGLAQRIFGSPMPNIALYDMLISVDPRSPSGDTIFLTYKTKLIVTAELMANG
ncbi:MAG TPA: hypothetical protein VMP01_05505 [Pirellulaceae bacterium]|nr:hypothetical protein [Pirellulaceae bacterium]